MEIRNVENKSKNKEMMRERTGLEDWDGRPEKYVELGTHEI
jgi:hypothetical protein